MKLFQLDKIWCGQTQVPAVYLNQLTNNNSKAKKLALLRIFTAFLSGCEILGYFFITLGLAQQASIKFFAVGISLKIGGGLVNSVLQNKSGVLWSMEIQSYLKTIKIYSQEINTYLTNNGCAEQEILAISSLPSEIYQSELNSYQRSRMLNLGIPITCGVALFLNFEIISGVIIIALGIAAFPIGEHFFKSYIFRNESKLRLARSAQLLEFINQVYQEHIFQTFQINFLSQIPLLLFFLRFFWDTGNLLSVFFGYTQGLIGLSSTLAFQRLRVTSLRTTTTVKHLINALSSEYFIITPKRWESHCAQKEIKFDKQIDIENGVVFDNFAVFTPSRSQCLPKINCVIPSGKSCIIQAPSGYGKSTLLMALMHMIEHEGEIYFIKDSLYKNVHEMSPSWVSKKIFFYREENIDKNYRLVDLFQPVLTKDLYTFYVSNSQKFEKSITDLAWEATDNLVEQEINNIQKGMQSVFPKHMLPFLVKMRQEKNKLVCNYLKAAKGNLATEQIHPERSFTSLSAGEKRRAISLLAFEQARTHSDLQLVILDEPLAHLDKKSVYDQIEIIKKIQTLPHPPAQIIIAHHFIEEIEKNIQTISSTTVHVQGY